MKLLILALLTQSLLAQASRLDGLEKTVSRAEGFGAIAMDPKLQSTYLSQLKEYLGDFKACPSFETGLRAIQKQETKSPGLMARLWTKSGEQKPLQVDAVYQVRKITRPLHAFWIWNAKPECEAKACTPKEEFLASPWTPSISGSEFYAFEKQGQYAGAALLIVPVKKDGATKLIAFASNPISSIDNNRLKQVVAILEKDKGKKIELADAGFDYSKHTLANKPKDLVASCSKEFDDKNNSQPTAGLANGTNGTGKNGQAADLAGAGTFTGSGITLSNTLGNNIAIGTGVGPNGAKANQSATTGKNAEGGSFAKANSQSTSNPKNNNFTGNKNTNSTQVFDFEETDAAQAPRAKAGAFGNNRAPSSLNSLSNSAARTSPIINSNTNLNQNAPSAGAAVNQGPASQGAEPEANPNGDPQANSSPRPESGSKIAQATPKTPSELERLIEQAKEVVKDKPLAKEMMTTIMNGLANTTDPKLKERGSKELSGLYIKNSDVGGSYEALLEFQAQYPDEAKKMAQNVSKFYCEYCPHCSACRKLKGAAQ